VRKLKPVKLLIFSDIHSDARALERLMADAASTPWGKS
jgi:hypothetical protein